jgi:hypothetical protein
MCSDTSMQQDAETQYYEWMIIKQLNVTFLSVPYSFGISYHFLECALQLW